MEGDSLPKKQLKEIFCTWKTEGFTTHPACWVETKPHRTHQRKVSKHWWQKEGTAVREKAEAHARPTVSPAPQPVPPIRKLPQASYPYLSEGRHSENHNHRKLTKLITWPTALSNSMKLWAITCRATQDGGVMVDRSDKTRSTGEGNGELLQHSCLWLSPPSIHRTLPLAELNLCPHSSFLLGNHHATFCISQLLS